jgi:alanyl-tRNA synthetase
MPGAFIFGIDGQRQTIRHMWELATEEFGVDPDRIWISYFGGDDLAGQHLPKDELTRQIWLELGVPEARLVSLSRNQNFWIQGTAMQRDNTTLRKCGPNTELFYDRGENWACGPGCHPGCKCERFVEFSNSLFISHELAPEANTLIPIANSFTETVIGTERVAMILQGVDTIFDIQAYDPIFDMLRRFVGPINLPPAVITASQRIIVDHLRALHVLIADGAPPPGKNGRERIIKLLIRGVLTQQILLGIKTEEFLPAIATVIAQTFAGDNLATSQADTLQLYFEMESSRFYKTIKRGQYELERLLKQDVRQSLSGFEVVSIEKKWGMPHLLVAAMLHDQGMPFIESEYWQALQSWQSSSIGERTNFV